MSRNDWDWDVLERWEEIRERATRKLVPLPRSGMTELGSWPGFSTRRAGVKLTSRGVDPVDFDDFMDWPSRQETREEYRLPEDLRRQYQPIYAAVRQLRSGGRLELDRKHRLLRTYLSRTSTILPISTVYARPGDGNRTRYSSPVGKVILPRPIGATGPVFHTGARQWRFLPIGMVDCQRGDGQWERVLFSLIEGLHCEDECENPPLIRADGYRLSTTTGLQYNSLQWSSVSGAIVLLLPLRLLRKDSPFGQSALQRAAGIRIPKPGSGGSGSSGQIRNITV